MNDFLIYYLVNLEVEADTLLYSPCPLHQSVMPTLELRLEAMIPSRSVKRGVNRR